MRGGGQDSWVPNRQLPQEHPPPTPVPVALQSAAPTVGPTGVAVLREEGQSEDEEGVACSTAPLLRMQCDTRHQEMAAKVQGKNTVIYGLGICCQIRNRDLISGKSLPVPEQMGRCVQCSILFNSQLIIIPHLQIPSLKQTFFLAMMPAAPGGWTGDESVLLLDGWLFPLCELEPPV